MKKEIVISGIVGFIIGALFISLVPLNGGMGLQGKMSKEVQFSDVDSSDWVTPKAEYKDSIDYKEKLNEKLDSTEMKNFDELGNGIKIDDEVYGENEMNVGNYWECREKEVERDEQVCQPLEGDEYDDCVDEGARLFDECWTDRGDYS